MISYVPAIVAREFRESRLVVFSTLCVYPIEPIVPHGWDESVDPVPLGDYANSCVGRERAFAYGSRQRGTPGRLMRVNYSIDIRCGVLIDIANWVMQEQPIPIATSHASITWQGDCNAQMLRTPSRTAPRRPRRSASAASVRLLAHEFGKRFGKTPRFDGVEQPEA